MSGLSYQSIRATNIILPFFDRTVHEPTNLTYGCGAASYDVRLAEDCHLRDGYMSLASTMEQFTMPDDVRAVVHDKSSLVRSGIVVQNTFIDPGWCGYLTLEISYHPLFHKGVKQVVTDADMVLRAGMPIAQIAFEWLDYPTARPYSGEYQHQQAGPRASKFKGG